MACIGLLINVKDSSVILVYVVLLALILHLLK